MPKRIHLSIALLLALALAGCGASSTATNEETFSVRVTGQQWAAIEQLVQASHRTDDPYSSPAKFLESLLCENDPGGQSPQDLGPAFSTPAFRSVRSRGAHLFRVSYTPEEVTAANIFIEGSKSCQDSNVYSLNDDFRSLGSAGIQESIQTYAGYLPSLTTTTRAPG